MIATGIVFWMLVAMLAVVLVTYFGRLADLRRAQIDYQDFVKGIVNVLNQGNVDEALAICEDTPAPVAQVVAVAIRNCEGNESTLRSVIDAQGRAEVGRLERRLAVLAIIAQVAPLVGLFGTLTGFVKTVMQADAGQLVMRVNLMNGAMEALTVAIAGIVVAVFATVLYASLKVRLDRVVVELEAAASLILGYLSRRAAK